MQMLRAAKAPKEYIDAAKAHRCDVCVATKPPARISKVALPKPYTFNHEVGIDVLEVKDAAGAFFDILNVVDYGTAFEQRSSFESQTSMECRAHRHAWKPSRKAGSDLTVGRNSPLLIVEHTIAVYSIIRLPKKA